MGSKEEIFARIRAQQVPAAELPSLQQTWIEYPDRLAQFASVIQTVGGRCFTVNNVAEINAHLAETPAYAAAKQIVSLVPGAGTPNLDLNTVDDPHTLETVDFAILPGQFGIAENGAIWVTDTGVKHRAIYFITQHLSLVIPANQILPHMHAAYDRLAFPGVGFGVFISGPSKTADIEQSLVIGAHGPRSLTVFCVRE